MLRPASLRARALEHSIERQIVQRTWGRIHGLSVEATPDRVIIHGHTSSYYIKQLALEGALEALESNDTARVELDIDVGRGHRESPPSGTQPRNPWSWPVSAQC
jgi:hypothetical protein